MFQLTRLDLICAVGRAGLRMLSQIREMECPHLHDWDVELAWTAYQHLGAI